MIIRSCSFSVLAAVLLQLLVNVPAYADHICFKKTAAVNRNGKVKLARAFRTVTELPCPKRFKLLVPNEDLSGINADQLDGMDSTEFATTTALNTAVTGLAERLGNVVYVSTSGDDFTSVATALNSITDAAIDNPYLVVLGPGIFNETETVVVPSFVHLRGAGPGISVLSSENSDSNASVDAATLQILDNSRVSELTVQNTATVDIAIGIYAEDIDTNESLDSEEINTVVTGVKVEVLGAGGLEHIGIYSSDAHFIVRNSNILVGGTNDGGSDYDAGVQSADTGIVYIFDSRIFADLDTSVGYGTFGDSGSIYVYNSYVTGGHEGVRHEGTGTSNVYHSFIRSFSGTAINEVAGALSVYYSQLIGNGTHSGTPNCVYSVDGSGTDVAC